MKCSVCEEIEKKSNVVYEDDLCYALVGSGAVGHVSVVPKKHVNMLSELEKDVVNHLFTIASYSATVIFESLGAQGTNILCNSNKNSEHLSIDIVPRSFSDDLDFQWAHKQVAEDEIQTLATRIKDKTFFIGKDKRKDEKVEIKTRSDKVESKAYKDQMRRMP